jgi:membrane peptidoglycan carboxypeptidase
LVYILENNRIVSKERMLEVYFNIIEWGPNVYGIGEASSFYFQKIPSELSLNECLFLANIIPSPRKFISQFNSEGNLKPYAINRDRYIKSLMLRRGIIMPEDTIYQVPLMVSGRARSFIKIKVDNTIKKDSLSLEEFDF